MSGNEGIRGTDVLHFMAQLELDIADKINDCSHDDLSDLIRMMQHQLEDAHHARGFRPRVLPGLHNGLADPAEMMVRAFHLWQQTRWPGRNGRIRYAHTLFNLYVIRSLALLSMRVWDAGASGAGDRLAQVQGVLDQLWTATPADRKSVV